MNIYSEVQSTTQTGRPFLSRAVQGDLGRKRIIHLGAAPLHSGSTRWGSRRLTAGRGSDYREIDKGRGAVTMMQRAKALHASLKHPVIEGDGHWLEPVPVFLEYLCDVGSAQAVDRMRALWQRNHAWYRSTWSERQHHRTRRSNWWGVTSKTLDKATALLPALLNERLPDLGIDFALIYPSLGLALNGIAQHDLRRAATRAYNKMTIDMFAPYAARFAPVAIIPAHTPQEAIEELEYAVDKLGYRAIMLKGNQERPIPSAAEGIDAKKAAWYVDTIALDSP